MMAPRRASMDWRRDPDLVIVAILLGQIIAGAKNILQASWCI